MHTAGAPGRSTEPPESRSEPSRLTREQVVDRIVSINPTAKTEFLSCFEDCELTNYLDHLVATLAPRGRHARWERTAETPAILTREPRH